jgi:hypothetical protein
LQDQKLLLQSDLLSARHRVADLQIDNEQKNKKLEEYESCFRQAAAMLENKRLPFKRELRLKKSLEQFKLNYTKSCLGSPFAFSS